MKPRILIITKTYSTSLGVIRSLGTKGYEVELFYIAGKKGMSKIAGSSKYVKKVTEFIGRKDKEIVEQLLAQYSKSFHKYFLFPTDDYAASLIDRYGDVLSKIFFMPYVEGKKQDEITRLMDKSVQNELARRCGFKTAKEWIVSLKSDEIAIPSNVIYPCFVKPLVSARGMKNELGVCKNQEELINKLCALKKSMSDRSVLIQEYLNVTQEYSMSGVCLNQEIILPAIVKKLKVAQYEKGVTLFGELVALDEIDEVKEALYEFLKSLHFIGMFDLEVMCVGNTVYFGEMNFRSGGPNYAYYCSGINLPEILVEYITSGSHSAQANIKLNKKFLYEKVVWEDYQKNYISKKELYGLYKESDYFLLENIEDPKPGKVFRRRIKLRVIKSKMKRVILALIKMKK